MKVSAGLVCVTVFSALLWSAGSATAHGVMPVGSLGQVTNYVGTPAGIGGQGSAGTAAPKSAPSAAGDSNALEIPEPAAIALFGLVALAIAHRLRRLKA